MARIAINGLGRIGRAALKIVLDTPELELVAINDLVPLDNLAYLLRYDTAYGRYPRSIAAENDQLIIDGQPYRMYSEKDPAQLPWGDLHIDIVLECTGVFTKREGLEKHLQAGAQRVILSAPAKSEGIATIVHGVNEAPEDADMVSTASCTTNCITPVVEVMSRRIGVKKSHDDYDSRLHVESGHCGCAKQKNIVGVGLLLLTLCPLVRGAAIATTQVLPHFKNKFDGVAVRGPIPVGSISDITFVTDRATAVDEVNRIFRQESETDQYQGILGYTEEPLVSTDIVQDARASIVDLTMTQVVDGDLVKVMAWYDNEWGYAQQMIREAVRMAKRQPVTA